MQVSRTDLDLSLQKHILVAGHDTGNGRMTTGQAQLFRLSLTAGIALLRLLKMAARHYGSSLKPEDALHVGWRLRLRSIHRWFDQLLNVTFQRFLVKTLLSRILILWRSRSWIVRSKLKEL